MALIDQATKQIDAPVIAGMLIDGKIIEGTARIEVRNPANPDEVVGFVPRCTAEAAAAAIASASRAQPDWGAITYVRRAAILGAALDTLSSGIDRRAVLYVRENGKILSDARGELAGVITRQKLTLELAEQMDAGYRDLSEY